MKFSRPMSILAVSMCLSLPSLATGPTGVLYATNLYYSSSTLDRIQGGSVLSSTYCGNTYELPLAVYGDVRTFGPSNGNNGEQYDLNGDPTYAAVYTNSTSHTFGDGTSDGVYNYGLATDTGEIYQFDRDWQGGIALFAAVAPATGSTGITMNARDGSFWVGDHGGSNWSIQHYGHSGNLLDSFAMNAPTNANGLAYDPLDGTLWLGDASDGVLYQYSTSGTLLQSNYYAPSLPYRSYGYYGLEFNQATPEPASICVLGLGALGILRRRNRR